EAEDRQSDAEQGEVAQAPLPVPLFLLRQRHAAVPAVLAHRRIVLLAVETSGHFPDPPWHPAGAGLFVLLQTLTVEDGDGAPFLADDAVVQQVAHDPREGLRLDR